MGIFKNRRRRDSDSEAMESEKIRELVQEVVRAYREVNPSAQRPFLNEMACFLVQATFLQCPGLCSTCANERAFREMIDSCVKLLTLEDCPAVETIQLQVSAQAVMFVQSRDLTKEGRQHEKMLDKIIDEIINIKVLDKRELPNIADNFHRLVLDFIMETSKRIDGSLSSGLLSAAEIQIALDSVFPRTGFLYWMELSKAEKVSQLYELSNIIPGIRAYNSPHAGIVDQENIDAVKVTIINGSDAQDALAEGLEIQLNGFCPMTIVRNQGFLLHGDPMVGLVRVREKAFAFSTPCALNEFVNASNDVLMAAETMAIKMPHLVNLLGLQHDPRFSCLAITHILELVNKRPLPYELSTQTAVHIQPQHQFDEETLFKRALQLASKKTHSTQTIPSHFHRDSYAQVWKTKDKSTQSLFRKGTTMPKRVKYFENLQGPPHYKFNLVDISLDV